MPILKKEVKYQKFKGHTGNTGWVQERQHAVSGGLIN